MFVSARPNTLFNRNLDNAQYFRDICIFSFFFLFVSEDDNNRDSHVVGGGAEEANMTGVTGDGGANGDGGLIVPKKLQNPVSESTERQRLHRELMLNQKLGKNVLNQKSELQRAMEKYKDNQFKKELEQQRQENMTPLERVIEQRAKRLEIVSLLKENLVKQYSFLSESILIRPFHYLDN
ncbi:unnamed protein product [Nesidiocoris tenuis]|uniref:Uncharacterized protein n=1 Tax=Nesidiocoris tenuis TaxID=355587 RepID=A0A6H5GQH7_9HEMI|nr:unnamed protein product [Nesidiocoris tenuis]